MQVSAFEEFLFIFFEFSGKQKIDVGHFTSFYADEEIQQRKFLSLVNSLIVNLLNGILTSKMDYGTEQF